jgi:CRP-like cAMP-binding protein
MTDLRDQLPAFEDAARRLLHRPARRLVLVNARPANCHPDRPVNARGLCHSCYHRHRQQGTLDHYPTKRTLRFRVDFVADYVLLRSEGYTRRQIAERLGMTYPGVTNAYLRAVRAGALTPDRRTA